jgi:hypothetical protein
MPLSDVETSRAYPFERGGAARLELRWRASFKEIRVLVDGATVSTLERAKIPKDGTTLRLPDGTTLAVRLRGILGIELLRDGAPLPGSDLDPARLLRNAAVLMAVAALIDGATDGALLHRALVNPTIWSGPFFSRPYALPLSLDAGLLGFALPTVLGSRVALAIGVVLFAARFGVGGDRPSWTLIYGVVTTWALATHLFAAWKR